jgi:hypothetical protein
MHTGVIGERVTTPRSPLGVMALGDAAPSAVGTSATISNAHFASISRLSVLYAVGVWFRHTGVRAESVDRSEKASACVPMTCTTLTSCRASGAPARPQLALPDPQVTREQLQRQGDDLIPAIVDQGSFTSFSARLSRSAAPPRLVVSCLLIGGARCTQYS